MESEDKVAQFVEITSSSPELARQYLQLTEFNIEQAMQLYFENGGVALAEETLPSTGSSRMGPRARASVYEDESGVVHIDSDDETEMTPSSARLTRPPPPPPQQQQQSALEDDAAYARRLQEEMYSAMGNGDQVRAPMARTTETLVGPEAHFDGDDMHASILGQLRAHQSRNSEL